MARTWVSESAFAQTLGATFRVRTKERAMMVLRPAAMMEQRARRTATLRSGWRVAGRGLFTAEMNSQLVALWLSDRYECVGVEVVGTSDCMAGR